MIKKTQCKNHSAEENKDELVRSLLKVVDNPEWFMGLSVFQMEAANSLQASIRDDLQQETSHRVKDALCRLGLQPVVGHKKLWLAMRLSHGNDLAFLWFLMELYYRHACDKCHHSTYSKYSISEQLIMSAIAHLDMIPTLRELNKILPEQIPKPKPEKVLKKRKKKRTYLMPYFEKLPRPVLFYLNQTARKPNPVAEMEEYNKYLNPNYEAPNETNRWYANYILRPHKRIVKFTTDGLIKDVFEKEKNGSLADFLQSPILCEHDKVIQEIQENKTTEHIVAKRDMCEKNFEIEEWQKKQACKKFEKELNLKIAAAKEQLKLNYGASGPVGDGSNYKCESHNKLRMMCVSKQGTYDEDFSQYDFGHGDQCKKNIYFEAPSLNKPFKFNYDHIFDLGAKDFIKDKFNLALTETGDVRPTLDYKDATRKYCMQIWKDLVQEKKKKSQPKINVEEVQKVTYYNPFDEKLMSSMLREALDKIKQDKRFVLASMPDAHKFPILKTWIKKRYGYFFSLKERKKALRRTSLLIDSFNKIHIYDDIPRNNNLAKRGFVTYKCRNHLLKKTNMYRERYFHNFKIALLDRSRVYWNILRPHQCSNGPPRDSFFAYLPARQADIHLFRIWKPSEHIKAIQEWKSRQRGK